MNPNDPTEPGTGPTEPTASEPQPTEASEPYVPTGADYTSGRDFVDFPLSAEILRAIHEIGYRTATPVQAAVIEPALAGRDMLVRAKTGTGKTAAFSIPIVEKIADGERIPRAIVLAPTRELAQQTSDELTNLSKYRDVSVALLVGGVPMGPQEKALEGGASIIVGTPGRVLDHLRRRNLDLSKAELAVLDEADEMASMGFFEDVTAILDTLPKTSQKLLVSATVSTETQRIIDRYLKDAESIMLSTDADQVEGIEHTIYETPPGQHKVRSLLYLLDLEDPTSAIIFCNTREDAATVASFLDRQGLDAQLISGELPQARRTKVMQQVKAGLVRFLVATDVAARGIDISDLSHVIQYSLPQDPAIYLHRTGRTGRIGKKGTAISLVSGSDLQTKRVLENQHKIVFVEKKFPSPEECVHRRVERQAAQIRDAMGQLVFEAYLPTAKTLMQRPDGEALVAAALRAFFQWDRTRRAAMSRTEEGEEAEPLPTGDERGRRSMARAAASGGRRERGERERERDRGPRREERRDDRRDRKRDERPRRGERQETKKVEEELDLDALLVDEGEAPAEKAPKTERAPKAERPAVTAEGAEGAEVAPPAGEDGDKKKRRRRRRRKKTGEGAEAGASEAAGDEGEGEAEGEDALGDDLDALLVGDDAEAPAPKAAKPAKAAPAKPKAAPKAEKSDDDDDLDSLLSME